MHRSETMFGTLASSFSASREDVATEALAYIIARADGAIAGLNTLLAHFEVDPIDNPSVSTQVSSDSASRPDLILSGDNDSRHIILENKFWAGFTDNQPVAYLTSTYRGRTPEALVFVVPEARLVPAWSTLIARCEAAGLSVGDETPGSAKYANNVSGCRLVIVSWRALLDSLETGVTAQGDPVGRAEIDQLRGLIHLMDQKAFHPLKLEELTDHTIPQRVINYTDLVEDICAQLEYIGTGNRKGTKPTHSYHTIGRYVRLGDYGCWIGVNFETWSARGRTPLWLCPTYGWAEGYSTLLIRRALETRSIPGEGAIFHQDMVWCPIDLPLGCEREDIVHTAAEHVTEWVRKFDSFCQD